jgi:hypothetical protein
LPHFIRIRLQLRTTQRLGKKPTVDASGEPSDRLADDPIFSHFPSIRRFPQILEKFIVKKLMSLPGYISPVGLNPVLIGQRESHGLKKEESSGSLMPYASRIMAIPGRSLGIALSFHHS